MRAPAVALLFVLTGCATVHSLTTPALTVYAPKVTDAKQWEADKAYCEVAARGYTKQFDLFGTVNDSLQGAAGNISQIPLSPVAPVYGAAAGAGTDILKSVGLLNVDQKRVYVKCLDKLTDADHSALVLEPNE